MADRRQFITGIAAVSTVGIAGCSDSSDSPSEENQEEDPEGDTEPNQDSPTQIEDWNDLNAIRENLDDDYELVNDLDEETAGYNEYLAQPEEGWEPIGSDTPFSGSFDGEDNAISGLEIDRPDMTNVGLFSAIEEAVIENVDLTEVDIQGKNDVGSLVGQNEGQIINARASGEVTAETVLEGDGLNYARVGGLVGDNRSEVTDSHATCVVTATGEFTNAGGLVGSNNLNTASVSNSHAEGDVTASSNDAGGLVGANQGDISQSYATGDVTGNDFVGGLVGQNRRGSISESFATGNVTGESESGTLAGGLVGGQGGIQNDDSASITDSYATGDVTGVERVGGFIGSNRSVDDGESDGVIERCYATGTVSGNDDVGGFAGKNSGSISESYWDNQSTNQDTGIGDNADSGVEGIATEEMYGESATDSMPVFDFDETWDVVTDPADYPELSWQN